MALRDPERSDRREDEDEIGKGSELERPFLGGTIKKYQDHPWASYLSARDCNEIQRRARGFLTPRVGLLAISFLLALFIIKDIYLVDPFATYRLHSEISLTTSTLPPTPCPKQRTIVTPSPSGELPDSTPPPAHPESPSSNISFIPTNASRRCKSFQGNSIDDMPNSGGMGIEISIIVWLRKSIPIGRLR
jgi:hypothetical protein